MHTCITLHYITLHCITWHDMTWHNITLHYITYIHISWLLWLYLVMRLGFGSLQNPVQLPAQGSAGCAIADRDPIWPGEFRGWTRGTRWWLPNHATSFVEHSFNIFSWVHHGSPGYQDFIGFWHIPKLPKGHGASICRLRTWRQVENITTWRHLKGIGWRAQHWENQKLQRSTPRAHVQMYSWALESVPWICTDVTIGLCLAMTTRRRFNPIDFEDPSTAPFVSWKHRLQSCWWSSPPASRLVQRSNRVSTCTVNCIYMCQQHSIEWRTWWRALWLIAS